MVRKRSLASVLYEDDTSSDRNRNSRNRSISNILGEESTSNQSSSSSRLVLCNCPKCNGRLIDPRTKVIHDLSNESSEISIESFQNRQEIEESERIDEYSSSKSTTLTQDVNLLEIEKDDIPNITFLPRILEISNIIADDEVLNISSEDEMEEMEEISIETSVLYEDDTSSDRNRNSRNRSISNILGEESTSNQSSSSSRLVLCNCPKCNGRLIDPRTKVIHDLSNESSEISIESFQNRQEIEESERIDEYSSSKSTTLTQDVNLLEIEKDDIPNITFLPRILLNISSEDEMEEMEEISIESEEESADKFSNIFEDYSSPNYDPDEPIDPKSTNNNSYLWILL
ncbi:hypothetical protein Glove_173g28 [Diversispora epigaea]|uniref:Uncharacterized protein n=1 Tax=Diversispora epigaea TaxID=1348612 RepID=A0A397IXY6_9GLOM|nr:hypothetical protein Glove_173g28 [Diversispora epigaea]